MIKLEYIWLDGTKPTHLIRSKTRIVELANLIEDEDDDPEIS